MQTIEIKNDKIILEFSKEEIGALYGALNAVSNSLEAWEFGIRMGIEIDEARIFLDLLSSARKELCEISSDRNIYQ